MRYYIGSPKPDVKFSSFCLCCILTRKSLCDVAKQRIVGRTNILFHETKTISEYKKKAKKKLYTEEATKIDNVLESGKIVGVGRKSYAACIS